jgi:hypothetical protein
MNASVLGFPFKEVEMNRSMNYEEDFEMLTLRPEYFKKIPNPESVNIQPYKYLAALTAKAMYEKCKANFEKVGFDVEDIKSIATVYLLTYVGVYDFSVNEAARDRFLVSFLDRYGRDPDDKEIEKGNRNTAINFLRQKLHHCSKVCERKSRNIVGARSKKFVFAYTSESKAAHPSEITQDYKKYGYRKIAKKEFDLAKEAARKAGTQELIDAEGFRIVEINEYSANMYGLSEMSNDKEEGTDWESFVQKENFVGFYMEESPEYLSDPEEALMKKQDELSTMKDHSFFENLDPKLKKNMIKRFINANKGNKRLSEELKTARNFLKN